METARTGGGREAQRAVPERDLFKRGPPLRLQERLRLARPGKRNVAFRACLAVLVGWVPLAVLTSLQSAILGTEEYQAFLSDVAVHARFLAAAPLFVLAETVCAPQLAAIALHFSIADLVPEHDRPRFEAAVASTRAALDSTLAEIGVVVLSYAMIAALLYTVPAGQLPVWQRYGTGAAASHSAAGWWYALVSLPLLLTLFLGWMWRLCLWTRFLWLTSRLELCLVPSHPDHAAGLMFVGYSVRAFSILALALGTILAGTVANTALRYPEFLFFYAYLVAGAMIFIAVLFIGPLLVFSGRLKREWQRGLFAYEALADHVGQMFERKWLDRSAQMKSGALEVSDFSAATDLYRIVSNVYAMRIVPVDPKSIVQMASALLLPFLPVVLLAVPGDKILTAIKLLLF